MTLTDNEIKDLLDAKFVLHNVASFADDDPVQIPRRFDLKEDIEIAAFMTATIAWGNRAGVIKSAKRMMDLMGNSPYDFIMSHNEADLERFDNFVHRTFQPVDAKTFIRGLKHIYSQGGPEPIFRDNQLDGFLHYAIHEFKKKLFEVDHLPRTLKHVADPMANRSHAKRIHLFLKWMVRRDNGGIDIGIWNSISPAVLSCPLDVHTGRVGRKLGLITTKQDNLKSLGELDSALRRYDPTDPAKYDVALFCLSKEGF
jgi:uncharacterized protein (TIGR02757 family)